MKTMILFVNLISLCLPAPAPAAQDAKPPFAKEAQGDWHVLAAHRENKNIAQGPRAGSRVSITDSAITWHDPQHADKPLIVAACVRPAPPANPDPKKQADPNELVSTVRGSLCPVQDVQLAARWRITDTDTLIVLVEVAAYKGNRNGTYSGAAPHDVVLVCQRKPVPAALKPDPDGDAKRFVGKWARLAELDDANTARTRPEGNVEFTATDFFKYGSYKPGSKPHMDGTWKLAAPQGERGRIDITFRSGIEGNQGRAPSLYTFHGDDLLIIVHPEGGWPKGAVENQELRQPPAQFGSDGNNNMLILRRMPTTTTPKQEAAKGCAQILWQCGTGSSPLWAKCP